jgi:hypothetical protein
MAAGLILLALMARRCPVYALVEIDTELVDLEPQTFEVKLDREFLY